MKKPATLFDTTARTDVQLNVDQRTAEDLSRELAECPYYVSVVEFAILSHCRVMFERVFLFEFCLSFV